ncbi:VOC family protein [Sinomonas sp. JGH33]|uniref:VOC family protein n=1 Tax=Sinomonas terricola TaxID=3110330 RepID=A0ABU5T0R5_9MICC|nr:VOC family protein [Sinomonas sp. JGH33]MEA5453235.1 VOC family protein [Sinomonas sp. JGH33]
MTHESSPTTPTWFDISTPDGARARAFYQGLFGWQINVLDETYALVGEAVQPGGGIGQAGAASPYVGIVIYFPVENVDAMVERAKALGAKQVMGPVDTRMSRIAVLEDLDGNRVGLISR